MYFTDWSNWLKLKFKIDITVRPTLHAASADSTFRVTINGQILYTEHALLV
jgi:hypothetical protein